VSAVCEILGDLNGMSLRLYSWDKVCEMPITAEGVPRQECQAPSPHGCKAACRVRLVAMVMVRVVGFGRMFYLRTLYWSGAISIRIDRAT
jgi:hypothetical protein